jgi:hypothetical protein
MIEGALILLGGWIAGYVSRTVTIRNKRPKPKPDPPAICGCGDHFSMHDEEGCHATHEEVVERGQPSVLKTGYDGIDRTVVYQNEKFTQVRCGCKRYAGPEPLPSFYAPPQIG